jgi:PAS domain S-box-containing protein
LVWASDDRAANALSVDGVKRAGGGSLRAPLDTLRLLALGAAVALAYVIAAHIGFRVAFVAEQVTTVWAPTGLAIAALLLLGVRMWPAVWAGAFLANAATDAPAWTAVVIATGNTLEAVAAVSALRRLPRFDPGLSRVNSTLSYIVIAAAACPTLSATVGVGTLCAAGLQPWTRFGTLWFDWWLGDALGALIIAPAILTSVGRSWSRRDWMKTAAFVGSSATLTYVVFGLQLGLGVHPLEYVVFPVVIAAAVTAGTQVTSLAVLGVSAVSIWHTVNGTGPFASAEINRSLILLQVFMGVLAGTALLLAAAVAERQTSERREREAAEVLRQREEMMTLAQRAGGVATFEWDFRNKVAHCSAEFFHIFGLPARAGLMQSEEWGRFVHPDDREAMIGHLARVIAGIEPAAADYRIVRRDGSTRWLTYAGQIQQTPDGDRLLGAVADITARVETETVLREAKAAAESANQLKDQFLATLSHELRTPLNAILGYARMLHTNAIEPDKRQRAIEVIERNAIAQKQLVEELLDMSRITTGQVRLDPEPVPVATVLREAIDGVKPAAEAKGITLAVDIDPFAGTVTADTTRLQQVFWNLLTNAVKFTPQGGHVAAGLQRDGSYVIASIRDTGVGIAPEFLPFVFDPFRQADARFDRAHGGLGLGLAIARQLVELHGGTIHAASDGPGTGATFTIRLPRLSG